MTTAGQGLGLGVRGMLGAILQRDAVRAAPSCIAGTVAPLIATEKNIERGATGDAESNFWSDGFGMPATAATCFTWVENSMCKSGL